MAAADLVKDIEGLEKQAITAVDGAATAEALQQITQEFTGKKGALTNVMKQLGSLTPEERGEVGKAANIFKARLEELLAAKEAKLAEARFASLAETEFVDLSVTPREYAAIDSGALLRQG